MYRKGLQEVADGIFAYLQPDGGWGWSNAGLISAAGESLLVDTLFDLNLTREMLESMAAVTATKPIQTLVNTHANGDHCYGNQLVADAEVIASSASAAEMENLPPAAMAAMMAATFDPQLQQYLQESFGPFEFNGIEPPRVDRTFSRRLDIMVGERPAVLLEVGPAHTAGDVLVHLPDDDVMFTGDILFINGTPIIWDGPVGNWIAACNTIIDRDCSVIVPGHGPLTDNAGVRRVRDYLEFIAEESAIRHGAGMSASAAARDIELGDFMEWTDWERIAINVDAIYAELDATHQKAGVIEVFSQMAALKYGTA